MKTSVLVLSLLLCLTIVPSGYSQKRSASSLNRKRSYCANAESIREMDECQLKIRHKTEAILNRSYGNFMQSLDEEQKTKLKQSQQAWKKYRDVTCDLASSIEYQTCIIEMTKKRTVELQEFPKRFLE